MLGYFRDIYSGGSLLYISCFGMYNNVALWRKYYLKFRDHSEKIGLALQECDPCPGTPEQRVTGSCPVWEKWSLLSTPYEFLIVYSFYPFFHLRNQKPGETRQSRGIISVPNLQCSHSISPLSVFTEVRSQKLSGATIQRKHPVSPGVQIILERDPETY